MFPHLQCIFIPFRSGIVTVSNIFPDILTVSIIYKDLSHNFLQIISSTPKMRTRNNKNGDKIIKVVYESEPNGIGFRQLSRKTGLYQKSLSLWLKYLTMD